MRHRLTCVAILLVAAGCQDPADSDGDLPRTPEKYASAFFDAWQADDRSEAELYAQDDVVELVFGTGDSPREGQPVCLMSHGTWACEVVTEDGLSFNVNIRAEPLKRGESQAISGYARWGGGMPGQSVPRTNYGRALMQAWLVGNRAVALLYAHESDVDGLFLTRPSREPALAERRRIGGLWIETWRFTDQTIRLTIDPAAVSLGDPQAVDSIDAG